MRSKIVLAALAAVLISGTAFAADAAKPAAKPAAAPADPFGGVYFGIQGGYDFDQHTNLQGLIGFNVTISPGVIIGLEGAYGVYRDAGGGGGSNGNEGYVAGRLGMVSGNALLYGLGGVSLVDGTSGAIGGLGVEFNFSNNLALRGQVAYNWISSGDFGQAQVGILYRLK